MDAYNRFSELYAQGRYKDALPFAEEALRLSEEEFGPDHQTTASLSDGLGSLYTALGHYAEAESLFKRALAIREKELGPNHYDVAISLNNLASLYRIWLGVWRIMPFCYAKRDATRKPKKWRRAPKRSVRSLNE